MSNKLHPSYSCECTNTTPLIYDAGTGNGEQDTGLCRVCNKVYDEGLYEKNLRQNVKGWHYDSIHDFLMEVNADYREKVATQPVA